MMYVITHADPAGGAGPRTTTVECDRVAREPERNLLICYNAEGGEVAGFASWYSFAPQDADGGS